MFLALAFTVMATFYANGTLIATLMATFCTDGYTKGYILHPPHLRLHFGLMATLKATFYTHCYTYGYTFYSWLHPRLQFLLAALLRAIDSLCLAEQGSIH